MHPFRLIRRNELHIATFSLSLQEHLDAADAVLSDDEKHRAERFVFERDRNRFITGRVNLRNLLADYTGVAPGALRFGYNDFGKPSIEGSSITFNISHSCDSMAILVAYDRKVGIDIEKIHEIGDIDGMARIAFTKAEQHHLCHQKNEAKPAAFYQLWVKTEALLKAAGTGLGGGEQRPSLIDEGGVPLNEVALVKNNNHTFFKIQMIDCGIENYMAAYCYESFGDDERVALCAGHELNVSPQVNQSFAL